MTAIERESDVAAGDDAEPAAKRIVEDPVLRTRYSFSQETDEQGEILYVEMWVDQGGGVTPHVHPSMEERFEVLGGRPQFLGGRKWREAGPGEEVVVPPGTRHAFRNRNSEVAHIVAKARPPLTLRRFLEDVAALSRAGKLMRPGLPKTLDGVLAGAVLSHHYRDMAVLMVPPPFLQRLIAPLLVPLGERRGYRPGRFAEAAGKETG